MKENRYKVYITCKQCGERFTLRGKKDPTGQLNTGFKQCVCDNERDFQVRSEHI